MAIAIGVIVGLFIAVIAADKFDKIAQMKGHQGYFWWCFWLGIIGWIMVAALPDRGKTNRSIEFGDAELPDL